MSLLLKRLFGISSKYTSYSGYGFKPFMRRTNEGLASIGKVQRLKYSHSSWISSPMDCYSPRNHLHTTSTLSYTRLRSFHSIKEHKNTEKGKIFETKSHSKVKPIDTETQSTDTETQSNTIKSTNTSTKSQDISREPSNALKESSNASTESSNTSTESASTSTESSNTSSQSNGPHHTPWKHHRPTKSELLSAASGTLERMRIRFKWLLTKQVRPFNTDDISAFFSWILVGNILWILLGTTTFFSLVILTMNTVSAQDYFARWVAKLITKETGIRVVFEDAIVPNYKSGVISFQKVFVSKRPGFDHMTDVSQGSQAVAAAAALKTTETEVENDDNYTQYDLTIDTVSVTLSFRRWMDGKGILQDVEVKGMRGIVDRRHVRWNPEDDASNYKNQHKRGDFEIMNFRMEDVMITLLQPDENSKPIEVSIFNCDLPQLRKHWLFYDFLNANNISGSYDNSLFTIHPRQARVLESDGSSPWTKINRLRIDNVDIKHLNRGVEGPFGWIESGNVDMLADIMLPPDSEDWKLSEMVQDIVERWEANLDLRKHGGKVSYNKEGNEAITSVEERRRLRAAEKFVLIDLRLQLNNTRAAVPLFTSDLTYVNNALIRPIVAYINSRDTYIPVNCRVIKKLNDLEGSWTIYDSHLMDDISAEVYDTFARNIADDEERARRMKKVGFWSLQFAAQLLLLSIGVIA